MTRKFNIVLFVLLVGLGGPFYWLMLNATTGQESVHPVTIAQLRRLALADTGEVPIVVRYENLGQRRVTSDLLAAGSGLRSTAYVVRAYQLVLADGGIVTIDRGLSRRAAQAEKLADFDPGAQAAVERALGAARLSLTLAPRLHHSGARDVPTGFGAGVTLPAPKQPYAATRGVVVIPTPDVGPDERMVYVQLEDGTELLFAGDIAPTRAAWMQQRPPARVARHYLEGRNREALGAWLRTVASLKAAAPALQVIAGHDLFLPGPLTHGFIAASDQTLRLPR